MDADPATTTSPLFFDLAILGTCFALSFFFSAAETALISANTLRLQHMAEGGNRSAKKVLELKSNTTGLLATLLLGNNVVNILSAALSTAIAIRLYGEEYGVVIATITTTIIVLIFCEVLPKSLAAASPEKASISLLLPVLVAKALLGPATWLLQSVTAPLVRALSGGKLRRKRISEDEIRMLVRLGAKEGVIERFESRFIQRVLDLSDTAVRHIMTRFEDVVSLQIDQPIEEALSLFAAENYSRLPAWREDPHHLIGILHLKDCLRLFQELGPDVPLSRALQPAHFIAPTDMADDVMRMMQENETHIVVVAAAGNVAEGIVTLEDILEEIVGEIRDEHDADEVSRIFEVHPGEVLAAGAVSLREAEDALGIELPRGKYRTLQGLVISRLSRPAQVGDVIDAGEAEVKVEAVIRTRITRARITRRAAIAPVATEG